MARLALPDDRARLALSLGGGAMLIAVARAVASARAPATEADGRQCGRDPDSAAQTEFL